MTSNRTTVAETSEFPRPENLSMLDGWVTCDDNLSPTNQMTEETRHLFELERPTNILRSHK